MKESNKKQQLEHPEEVEEIKRKWHLEDQYTWIGPGTKRLNATGTITEGHIWKYGATDYEITNILEPMKGYMVGKPI